MTLPIGWPQMAKTCGLALLAGLLAVPGWAGADPPGRVILCESRLEICVGAERLGPTLPAGWVAAVGDGPLRAAARDTPPIFLYPSRDAYRAALEGLSEFEQQRALQRRLEVVSGSPGTVPGFMFEVIRQDLLGIIAVAGPRDQAAVEQALNAAVALEGGMARFALLTPVQAVERARDSLARVRAENVDTPAANGFATESALLAEVHAALTGKPAPPEPFASPERAYFAPTERPPARRDARFVDQPWYPWRGGTVLTLRPAQAAEPPWSSDGLVLMYFDRETFFREVSQLTEAQMERSLAARLRGPPARELAELRMRLALAHATLVRQCVASMRGSDAQGRQLWTLAVARSTENLRLVAAHNDVAGPNVGMASRVARLSDDVALAAAFAQDEPPSGAAALLDEVRVAVDGLKAGL